MPLPTPILDDRSWQQLRDELVRRIPVYTPEWTDHNASDPGVTLLELFAFLGENLLYRFNQIPEATRLAFLKLLKVPLLPASSAKALLTATTTEPAGVVVPLASEARAGDVAFETTVELRAFPVSSLALARVRTDPPDKNSDAGVYAAAAEDAAQLQKGEAPAHYVNQYLAEDPADPKAAPVDFTQAVDRMLWVAVLAETGADKAQLAGHLLNVGVVPDQTVLSLDDGLLPCPGANGASSSPDVVWEISTGAFDPKTGAPVYKVLDARGDQTRGLTREGVVRLELPKDAVQMAPFTVADPDLRGTRDLPPMLEDEDQEAKVLFWLRAFRREAGESLPRLLWVGANATQVVQQQKAGPFLLGTGTAQPRQRYTLPKAPVVANTLELDVEEAGRFVQWTEVSDFDASGRDDRHFVVDREAGAVEFGDGLQGRAPQIGERIRARTWRAGGGEAGNVAPGAINRLPDVGGVEVTNPLSARGGAPDEPLAQALERVPAELRRHDRAVTASDFAELALSTPGAAVGRAEPLPLFHPPTRKQDAAGVVSVVVWPRTDPLHPNAPMPDRTMLREVCQRLDERRLITTELWVIPPTYKKIALSVGVQVKDGYGIEAVRQWVDLALRQFLAPLPPYGPSGGGWPLGRSVDAREVEAAALQVDGVAFLADELRIAAWDAQTQSWVSPARRIVALQPWEVPEVAELTVVEGDALPPGEALGPPPSPLVPVPIPTLKEEC